MIPRIEGLSDAQRKQFTERLLTLHQVLAESEDENYEHSWIINYEVKGKEFHGKTNHCGTAACAIGHAVWHHDRFPGLNIFKDSLGRPEGIMGIEASDRYFGPRAWRHIFDGEAYGMHPRHVTRQMAMKRIVEYIEHGLGCTLVEETPGCPTN